MFFLGFVSRITFSRVEKYVYRFSCTSLCYEGPDQDEVVRKPRSKGKRLKSPVLPLHSRSPSRDGLHRSGSLSRSHSRSSSRSRSLLHRTADTGSDVFNVPLSKSRQVRQWVVQSLSNEESKRLRSKYTPAFEVNFELLCPKLLRPWFASGSKLIVKTGVRNLMIIRRKRFSQFNFNCCTLFDPC